MLFSRTLPSLISLVSGGIHSRNTQDAILTEAFQANELAMMSNIGDISEDAHTHVLEAWVDLVSGEGPLFEGAPPSPLKVEA